MGLQPCCLVTHHYAEITLCWNLPFQWKQESSFFFGSVICHFLNDDIKMTSLINEDKIVKKCPTLNQVNFNLFKLALNRRTHEEYIKLFIMIFLWNYKRRWFSPNPLICEVYRLVLVICKCWVKRVLASKSDQSLSGSAA